MPDELRYERDSYDYNEARAREDRDFERNY